MKNLLKFISVMIAASLVGCASISSALPPTPAQLLLVQNNVTNLANDAMKISPKVLPDLVTADTYIADLIAGNATAVAGAQGVVTVLSTKINTTSTFYKDIVDVLNDVTNLNDYLPAIKAGLDASIAANTPKS
jgi:hypothetical protein